jgi:hypothetical protein
VNSVTQSQLPLGDSTEIAGGNPPDGCPTCGAHTLSLGPCLACVARRRKELGDGLYPSPCSTRRVLRDITARRCAWLEWRTGRGVTDQGASFATWGGCNVGAIVEMAAARGVERVYLVGERPHAGDADAFRAWVYDAPEGWDDAGHYLERADLPVLRYSDGTTRVEVLRAAAWSWNDPDPDLCRAAWAGLGHALDERWPGAVLLTTPATTGRELIARTIPRGVTWPTLDPELAELVRSTTGQGRIEFRAPAGPEIPQLVEVDGRTMYGALCSELPGGRPRWVAGEHREGPHARSRVLAHWRVPAGWDHLGLLPAWDADDGVWRYPSTPGERASGWIDGAELHLARRWGWSVAVSESLVWPGYSGAGPLDGWSNRLLTLIAAHTARSAPLGPMVARALRKILIDAVGALVGRSHVVTHSAPLDEGAELPEGARNPRVADGHLIWSEHQPAAWPEMVHPEWSAAIWARCRARMLDGPGAGRTRTGALHVPLDQVLAIRTDALYLTADPRWVDDGRAGRLRVKSVRTGPLPSPRDVAELLSMREGA